MRMLVLSNSNETTPRKDLETSEVVFLNFSDLKDPYTLMWFACIWWDKAFVEFGDFPIMSDLYVYLCKCREIFITGSGPISPDKLEILTTLFPAKAAKLRKACMLKRDFRDILKEDVNESSNM